LARASHEGENSLSKSVMNPVGPLVAHPLQPHQLTDDVTARSDVFTLCHMGVARLDADRWRLDIDGQVSRPASYSLPDLNRFDRVEIETIHQCQGSPLDPNTPTRRIANIIWAGVRLSDLMSKAGIQPDAHYLWSRGADFGPVGPVQCDAYL